VACTLAGVFVRALLSDRLARLVLDVPNDRSLHDRPVPRTGGIGLMLGAAVTLLVFSGGPRAIVIPAVLLAGIFLVDDVRSLPVLPRFVAQFAAAIAFVASTGPYAIWLLPLLVLGIVWSINLFNFMDGSNGLAGGMAVIGFAAYAMAAAAAGDREIALLAAVVAGAALGFLVWNFDPARIFLGDAGSVPLGFLTAAIGVLGWQKGSWPFWLPLLVFSPFVVDATVTLAQRVARGEKAWQAHRTHYYQRLIRSGWSHRRLALWAYALMLAAAASALSHRTAEAPAVAVHLAMWLLAYGAIALAVDRQWRDAERSAPRDAADSSDGAQ
jgi:UDP-N-acetylmuramyl pentapeptide phosphotransferase/UDP-N-acetylglucosamine-1-phosphate transferase